MTRNARIAVPSTSFSNDAWLRERLARTFPNCVFNIGDARLAGPALAEFCRDADAIIVSTEPVDEAFVQVSPRLQMVSKYGVGLDSVDVDACRRRNIAIGWTGGVNRRSVAEQTLGFMLGLCRNLFLTSRRLQSGRWYKNGGYQLSGKTVGIIGVGEIGKDVVSLLQPFGCNILVNDIIDQREYYAANGLTEASKESIFRESDVVTLHVPLTVDTKHLVDRHHLGLMKKQAFLINTSRGGVVDQQALQEALEAHTIGGAALDVFREEPPTDPAFLSLENLVCTPHIGGNAGEAVRAMGLSAIAHLERHFGVADSVEAK